MEGAGSGEAALEAGEHFAGHEIEAEIGRGGMGVVYRARHLALDRVRALKVLIPELAADEAYATRFRRECRLAASVEDPGIVTVHDAGEDEGRLWMSMSWIDGVDLGRLLADGPLRPERALPLLASVAGALDAAYAQGLIHRDVKPENVLVEGDLGSERAFLTDFGIGTIVAGAERPSTRLTGPGLVLGTADYMAPEQIRGEELDGRADIYSLACLAFHALAGRPPFAGAGDLAALASHGSAPRPALSEEAEGMPAEADRVLAAGMAIDPAARPSSARELIAGLGAAYAPTGSRRTSRTDPSRRSTVPLEPARGPRRRPRWAIVGAIVAAAAVIVAVVLLVSRDDESEPPAALASTSFDVPRGPVSVAAGADLVWVASRNTDSIGAFEPGGEPVGDRLSITDPRELALGFGYLWATGRDGLFRIELDGSGIERVLDLSDPSDVAVDDGRVWVLDREPEPRAIALDPETPDETESAFVGSDPRAIAAGAGAIWVANTGDETVSRINPETAETTGHPIQVGGRPTDIAALGGGVWAIDNFGGRLIPIDPAPPSGAPVAEDAVPTGPKPRGVAVGFGSVWVSVGESGTLERFTATSDPQPEGAVTVGDDPADVDVGGGSVWSADQGSATVSRVDPG